MYMYICTLWSWTRTCTSTHITCTVYMYMLCIHIHVHAGKYCPGHNGYGYVYAYVYAYSHSASWRNVQWGWWLDSQSRRMGYFANWPWRRVFLLVTSYQWASSLHPWSDEQIQSRQAWSVYECVISHRMVRLYIIMWEVTCLNWCYQHWAIGTMTENIGITQHLNMAMGISLPVSQGNKYDDQH